ncbi:MAG: response regulator [Bacteroidota bacterium]
MLKSLIIDDEIDICYLLSNILKQKKLSTRYVNNLSDATRMLQQEDIDLIFLDNHLGDGLGVNFINYIKQIRPDAKIVMITAYDTPSDRYTALNKGVDFFIGKPFTKEIINSIVEDFSVPK